MVLLLAGLTVAHLGVTLFLESDLDSVVCACLAGPCAQVFLPIKGKLCQVCLNKLRGDTP